MIYADKIDMWTMCLHEIYVLILYLIYAKVHDYRICLYEFYTYSLRIIHTYASAVDFETSYLFTPIPGEILSNLTSTFVQA